MVYSHKNVIVGAAALYISEKDSTSKDWLTPIDPAKPTGPKQDGPKLPSFASGKSAVDAFESDPGKADWRSAGYTTDGIEVSYEPDYGEVTVDQALDSVKMFKQGMRVSVNTTLAEATLENLIVAWGQQTGTLTASGTGATEQKTVAISGGNLGDDPVERALAFVGNAPKGAGNNEKMERVYHLRRSLQVESSAHSLSRTDATTFPVSFRCLPDSAFTSGEDYGKIIQRVVTA